VKGAATVGTYMKKCHLGIPFLSGNSFHFLCAKKKRPMIITQNVKVRGHIAAIH